MNFKKIFWIIILIAIIGLIVLGVISLNNSIVPINKENTIVSKEDSNIENGAFISNDENSNTYNVNNSGDIIIIEEKMFMLELNDIYLNYKDYEGKTIKYDGFVYIDEFTKATVIGREYYCCGYDSYMIGFECDFGENKEKMILENDKWFDVEGIICINKGEDGMEYPFVKITSIKEKAEEGQRVVSF